MFDATRDEVSLPTRSFQRSRDTADGEVVALGTPAEEDDLGWFRPGQGRHRRPSVVESSLGPLAEVVDA